MRIGMTVSGKIQRNYRECVLKVVNAAVSSGYRDRASTV
jgi:hypothetical protein